MTIDELKQIIQAANWFAALGNFQEREGMIALRTLEAWRSEDAVVDPFHEHVADQMQWLPVQSSELDPIHGDTLKRLAHQLGREDDLRKLSFDIYKQTLAALRDVPEKPLLRIGPHNFNLPARNAAAYAARMAASEICTDRQSFWCSLILVFGAGNWPCGIMPDKKIVVF